MTTPNITDYKAYKDLSNGVQFKMGGSTYTKGSEPANIKNQLHTMKVNASSKKRNNQNFENQRAKAHADNNAHQQHQAQRTQTQQAHQQHQAQRTQAQQAHQQHQAARNNQSNGSSNKSNGPKGSQNSSNAPQGAGGNPSLNAAKKHPITLHTVTLKNMAKHWIELQQPTSSGDTLQFNRNWSRSADIFYVNDGSGKLPLNQGILNGEPYGAGKNPSGSATPGYDKVYAEIDAFKISNTGNYVLDVFPDQILALKSAEAVSDDTKRKTLLNKVKLTPMPVAYLTDHFVPSKNSDGSLKKDANGNPVYEISKVTPFTVVYRGQADYKDPYEMTSDWYRQVVNGSASKATDDNVKVADHSKALALLQGLNFYLRGIDFVSYDYNTTSPLEYVDDMVDETANKVVPEGLDGINLSNVKLQALLPNGILSAADINAGGEPENNQETGEDNIVIEGDKPTTHMTNKAKQVMGDLGIQNKDY